MTRSLFSRSSVSRSGISRSISTACTAAALLTMTCAGTTASAATIVFNAANVATENIQNQVQSAAPGTIFQFGPGTYYGLSGIGPAPGVILTGSINPTTGLADPSNPTIFEGASDPKQTTKPSFAYTDTVFIQSYAGGSYPGNANVTLSNVVIRHYIDPNDTNDAGSSATALRAGPGWILNNVRVESCGWTGVDLRNGAQMIGGDVEYCGHKGVAVSGNNVTVDNVEIAYNNTSGGSQTGTYADAAGLKGGQVSGDVIKYCDVHDNNAVGIWADVNSSNWYIHDNFVKNNALDGIRYEISHSGTIYNNLIVCNGGTVSGGVGTTYGTIDEWPSTRASQIVIADSDTTNVYLNTVTAFAAQTTIVLQSDGGAPTVLLAGNGLRSNNVTFTGDNQGFGLVAYGGTNNLGSGSYSLTNNFHFPYTSSPTTGVNFFWGAYPYPNLKNFAFIEQTGDLNSTISQY